MPPIKSINDPRGVPIPDFIPPKILTQAIAEPPKKTTTFFSNEQILEIIPFQETIAVATTRGVYLFDLRNQIFKPVPFEIVEEPSE